MATAIATPLLKFALEKAAGTATTKLFEKGLNYINGGSDADKIQSAISDVFKEVKKIKDAVDEMSKKLDEGILRLRKDTLNTSLTEIENHYDSMKDIIDQAYNSRDSIKNKADLEKKLNSLQSRLNSRLKLVVEHVPGILGQINNFLQDREFLNSAAKLALDGSEDFLCYYMKMKVLVSTPPPTVPRPALTLVLVRPLLARLHQRNHHANASPTLPRGRIRRGARDTQASHQ